jgi:uncharacterized protein YgbK (DUF1537 family)
VLDALRKQHFVNIAATIKSSGDKFFTVLTNSLTRHLPPVHGYPEENGKPFKSLQNEKPVLVVIGSYDKVVGRQLYEATREEDLDIISLETKGLLSMRRRMGQMKACSEEAMRMLRNDRSVVITTNDCKYIPQLRHKMAYLLADITVELIDHFKPGALLTAGSDTNYAVCSRLQAESIDVLGSIRLNASTIITRIHTKITSALTVLRPVS